MKVNLRFSKEDGVLITSHPDSLLFSSFWKSSGH